MKTDLPHRVRGIVREKLPSPTQHDVCQFNWELLIGVHDSYSDLEAPDPWNPRGLFPGTSGRTHPENDDSDRNQKPCSSYNSSRITASQHHFSPEESAHFQALKGFQGLEGAMTQSPAGARKLFVYT